MNPDDWNIRADLQGDGGSSKWNYALLPILGLTACRWIWSKKSQEIEQANIIELKHNTLEEGKDRERMVSVALKDIEHRLVERQRAFCSPLQSSGKRFEIEKDLLVRTSKDPLLVRLEVEDGLKDIFKNDFTCADPLNTDEGKNGSLMWLYLKYWQLQVTLQSHQRAEAAVLGLQTKK